MSPDAILWHKIQSFELDIPGARLPFCARLARDNGWTLDFARRVSEEYKKFLFLACVAGHPVTPSDEVDQAWHLHLTYSRSYWDELCAEVLERPLHHEPTRGGAPEGAKFENWYEKTRASYRQHFGCEPPADIWPPSAVRFGDAQYFRRINLKRAWVVPKPQFNTRLGACFNAGTRTQMAPVAVAALVVPAVLAGCSASHSLNPLNWYGSEFLGLFWSLFAVIAVLLTVVMYWLGHPHDSQFPSQVPSVYSVARLSEAGALTVDAALASLHQRGDITFGTNGFIAPIAGHTPTHPFEQQVWARIGAGNSLGAVRSAMDDTLGAFDTQLVGLGLLRSPEARKAAGLWIFFAWGTLLLFGIAKIVVGLNRERPVGFLAVSCLIVGAVALIWVNKMPRLTSRGAKYLAHLRAQTARQAPPPNGLAADEALLDAATLGLVMGVALWGYSELDGLGLADLRRQLQPVASTGSDSSYDGGGGDSGGGGGDSGGGGCGGCGGCGGGD